MDLPERLRHLRRSKKVSQEQLAAAVEVARSNISGYEHGDVRPSYEILIRLADFFGVSLDYLVGRTDRPEINRSAETDDPDPRR
ncbi:MAG: helix-turn-helix transcriptional regulator [Thermaerobacter sp.]|nr:helix-turn-helix transcriptional regulator [Thermaerobacter sp.]